MNFAGKAGGCGYGQAHGIGNRVTGACANLRADPCGRANRGRICRCAATARSCGSRRIAARSSAARRRDHADRGHNSKRRADCECGYSTLRNDAGGLPPALNRSCLLRPPRNAVTRRRAACSYSAARSRDARRHAHTDCGGFTNHHGSACCSRHARSGNSDPNGRDNTGGHTYRRRRDCSAITGGANLSSTSRLPHALNRSCLLRPPTRLAPGYRDHSTGGDHPCDNCAARGRTYCRRRDHPANASGATSRTLDGAG